MSSRPYFCQSRPKTLYSRIKRQSYTLSSLICSGALLVAPVAANANPKDGQVTAGTATVTQTSPNRLDIDQQSQKAIINWKSFSIGEFETTNFNQPNASSITLNRVTGVDPSSILGNLTANGQVWLINPNGIAFGKTARVDVSGLLATTLDISDNDFMSGRYKFSSGGNGAMVVNEGEITVRQAGLAALVAPGVENSGIIQANLGHVQLSSAAGFTLDLYGDGIFNFLLDEKVTEAMTAPDGSRPVAAVVNSGQLIADGGKVVLSANVAKSVIDHAINMDGLIQATSVKEANGEIILHGGSEGVVEVSGALDASAPNGGDGGFIETSGAFVKVADTATVTTAAADGKTGTWLIDPNDFTVAATGGNITGEALSSNLANNSVTISTATQGTTGGNGDIFVNDAVSWSANTTLALAAERNIDVNANITATGNTAGLTLGYGGGGEYTLASGKRITLSGSAPVLKIGTAGSEQTYIVINSLGVEGDTSITTLQGMKDNLSGLYALGSDIDASATSGWNGGAGFEPVGNFITYSSSSAFTGIFDGLGHTVTGLTINRPTEYSIGLFGYIGNGSIVRNVGLVGGSVIGIDYVGGLVGKCYLCATISNSYSTGSVTGAREVGGLVGSGSYGTISDSYSTGSVTGDLGVGGLVGYTAGIISNSYSTGSVTGNDYVGGLVGRNFLDTISNSYSTGSVTGNDYVGGLVGYNTYVGRISNSYSTGSVTGYDFVGGLVGFNNSGPFFGGRPAINDSYWDTETSGQATSAGGTGVTTAQLKSGLPAGFDSSVWAIGADVNSGYPYLRWQIVSAPEPTPEPEPTPAPEPQAPTTDAQVTALDQSNNVCQNLASTTPPDLSELDLNSKIKLSETIFPPEPEFLGPSSWMKVTAGLTGTSELMVKYEEFFIAAWEYRTMARTQLDYAKLALANNDTALAQHHRAEYLRYLKLYGLSNIAAIDTYNGNLDATVTFTKGIKDAADWSLKFGAMFVAPGASVVLNKVVTATDFAVNWSESGLSYAVKETLKEEITDAILNYIPIDELGWKTISKYIEGNTTKAIGSSGLYKVLDSAIKKPEFQKALMTVLAKGGAFTASEITKDQLKAVLDKLPDNAQSSYSSFASGGSGAR